MVARGEATSAPAVEKEGCYALCGHSMDPSSEMSPENKLNVFNTKIGMTMKDIDNCTHIERIESVY